LKEISMLSVKDIALATERYGDGYECTVTFQVGDASYNTTKVKLPVAATREIVDLVIRRAADTLTVVSSAVRVAGEPLPLIEEAPAPEFAEVAEVPAVPVPAAHDEEMI
jgi:hypothetical protein